MLLRFAQEKPRKLIPLIMDINILLPLHIPLHYIQITISFAHRLPHGTL